MHKGLVGAMVCALGVFITGCSDECVDPFDCRNDKGFPPEGQEWLCNSDNKCVLSPIDTTPLPTEPDAGEEDGGVEDAGTEDSGTVEDGGTTEDAGTTDGGTGTGSGVKGSACTASSDCAAGLRCEGSPTTCQALQLVVTIRADDAGTTQASVARYDVAGYTALSEGTADSRYPRWGPGGARVSFAQGAVDTSSSKVAGDLTVRDIPLVAGQAVVLADGGTGNTESFRSMEWAPSQDIAWVRQHGSSRSGISVVPSAGGQVVEATTNGAFPDWAPDGTTFVYNITGMGLFTSSLGGSPAPIANSPTSAEQAHYNGVNTQLLFLANPDGATVQFAGDSGLTPLFRVYSLDVTSGGQPQLVADLSSEASTDGTIASYIASPNWSPDGRWAAYVRAYYFKPTSGGAVLCGAGTSPCQDRAGQVVFLRAIDPASGAPTGDEVRLAEGGTLPSISPDGQFVAFVKGGQLNVQQFDPTSGAAVGAAIVHPKNGFTVQTSDADDHRPRWQPR
ncbi:hypothetical protein LZ198_38675 [Myxococcus sp. K15C18031901]|uniref:TolB family protein n=1 Tax=Myxococcus dinghuensis TaxID=2906761 RepID=UPI0020A7AFF8|nr:hypothetical protein [Myxococcus dinghuensis]MCP3104807.1 hypothetical protein [Myxococcus dinghuensis]